jgi:hypothetical protein
MVTGLMKINCHKRNNNIIFYHGTLLDVTYLFTATHDTIRGTAHHHRTHERIEEGISQKLKLRTEAEQFHQ